MGVLRGTIESRYGEASKYHNILEPLLIAYTGLPSVVAGTLNVRLQHNYQVRATAIIPRQKTGSSHEDIKLQPCQFFGEPAYIIRPTGHEQPPFDQWLEIISPFKLRDRYNLTDGMQVEVEVEGEDEAMP